jgi:hypothetical protein
LTKTKIQLFNEAIEEFDRRTAGRFGRLTDINLIAGYCQLRGWADLARRILLNKP